MNVTHRYRGLAIGCALTMILVESARCQEPEESPILRAQNFSDPFQGGGDPLMSPYPQPVPGPTEFISIYNEPRHFTVGGSFYLLSPYFSDNTAYVSTVGYGSTDPATAEQQFNWGLKPSFRLFMEGGAGFA